MCVEPYVAEGTGQIQERCCPILRPINGDGMPQSLSSREAISSGDIALCCLEVNCNPRRIPVPN